MVEGGEQKSKWVTEDVIKGEESGAGNSCRGEEQMALGGVAAAAVHQQPSHGSRTPMFTGALSSARQGGSVCVRHTVGLIRLGITQSRGDPITADVHAGARVHGSQPRVGWNFPCTHTRLLLLR